MTAGDGMGRVGVAGVDAASLVTAHRTAPGRIVLTERGNVDGWIASDLTIDNTA